MVGHRTTIVAQTVYRHVIEAEAMRTCSDLGDR
jgi:hypothetical protein